MGGTRMPGSGGWCLLLASSYASGLLYNSVRSSDPGRIFRPKPGNGFSSSTEHHSRLLDGILLDLWPFKVCNISAADTFNNLPLKEETNNGKATHLKNAV